MPGIESITTLINNPGTTFSVANVKRKLIQISTDANVISTYILPAASAMRAGDMITIRRIQSNYNVPIILQTATGGDVFEDMNGGAYGNNLFLHDGDMVQLYSQGSLNTYRIFNYKGNFARVGEQVYAYAKVPGTLIRNGDVLNRADYPRLWNFVVANNLYVTDTQWQDSTNNYQNRGFFSSGNGTTTFRLPDDQGTFDRAYTNGSPTQSGNPVIRDTGRYGNPNAPYDLKPGNIQSQDYLDHTHSYTKLTSVGSGATVASAAGGAGYVMTTNLTGDSGGQETRPLNVAKIPLIYY
jgi:hypothetical protein